MRGARELETFVREHTAIAVTALVPEIALHLATEITPLWSATAEWLVERGVPPPFWAFAWAGGQALSRHLLDHPALVRELRVLDFAAGSGLVGIAAAKCGASRVTAVDVDEFAEVAIRMNAILSGVAITVECDDAIGHPLDNYDVILAGDVFYEQPMASRVGPWLRERARAGRTVLVGDPGRAYMLERDGIEELARYDVPTSVDLEGRPSRTAGVFRVVG